MPSIVGTVINARTKRPINGAIVSLLVADIQPSVEIRTTDEAGSFVLSGLQPGKYRVHALDVIVPEQRHRIGFSGTSEEVEVNTDDSRVVVEIQAAGSIVGTVTDAESGKAVRGATLRLLQPTGGEFMAAADSEGRFSLAHVNPGPNSLSCEASGFRRSIQRVFVPDALEAGVLHVSVFLEPRPKDSLPQTGTVKGFVLNESGNPAVGTQVPLIGEKSGWCLLLSRTTSITRAAASSSETYRRTNVESLPSRPA